MYWSGKEADKSKGVIRVELNDYSWNQHEREIKAAAGKLSTPVKISLNDDPALRETLITQLEFLTHAELMVWALRVAQPFLHYFDAALRSDPRIQLGETALKQRSAGQISAGALRQIGFRVNDIAKASQTATGKFAARTFAQAVATGHMRGHAAAASDYAIKTINLLKPDDLAAVRVERHRQLRLVQCVLKENA